MYSIKSDDKGEGTDASRLAKACAALEQEFKDAYAKSEQRHANPDPGEFPFKVFEAKRDDLEDASGPWDLGLDFFRTAGQRAAEITPDAYEAELLREPATLAGGVAGFVWLVRLKKGT